MAEPAYQKPTTHGVEAFALAFNKLHPKVRDYLQPLFGKDLDLNSVRIIVYHKNTSYLGTKVWVMGDSIVFEKGYLNAEHVMWSKTEDGVTAYRSNGAIDLKTINGMKVLAHELRHVWQSRTLPWWKQWWRFGWGIIKSLWYELRTYSHQQVWQEQDAIKFQEGPARNYILDNRAGLEQFKDLR